MSTPNRRLGQITARIFLGHAFGGPSSNGSEVAISYLTSIFMVSWMNKPGIYV